MPIQTDKEVKRRFYWDFRCQLSCLSKNPSRFFHCLVYANITCLAKKLPRKRVFRSMLPSKTFGRKYFVQVLMLRLIFFLIVRRPPPVFWLFQRQTNCLIELKTMPESLVIIFCKPAPCRKPFYRCTDVTRFDIIIIIYLRNPFKANTGNISQHHAKITFKMCFFFVIIKTLQYHLAYPMKNSRRYRCNFQICQIIFLFNC